MADKDGTERVAMLWPVELKAEVRERVGPRGLTDFTVDAVREKLGQPVADPEAVESKELGDARFLVQRLADCIALAGEYEDRESTLREIDLPPWVETTGWPENLARAINPIEPAAVTVEPDRTVDTEVDTEVDSEPVNAAPDSESSQVSAPVEVDTPVDREADTPALIDHPYEAGYSGFACVRMVMKDGFGTDCGAPASAHVGYQGPGVGDNVIAEPPKSHSNDLFKRLQSKAAEKGVDLSGVDLKPASQLQVDQPEGQVKIENVEEPTPEQVAEGMAAAEAARERIAERTAGEHHNHSWNKFDDDDGLYVGQPYFCACGDVMDRERVYPRDQLPTKPTAEPTTETPVSLEVPVPPATQVAPTAPASPPAFNDFDAGF